MKRYQTKDLSITVLPEADLEACLFRTNICLHPTGGVCPLDATVGCPNLSRFCAWATLQCPRGTDLCFGTGGCGVNYSYPIGTPLLEDVVRVREPRELEQLKDELRGTLEQLEQIDAQDLGGARDVSSLEEAEELEARLESALEDIRAQKKKLG